MLLVVSFIWNICQLWGCWKVVVDSFFRVNVFWTVPHSFGIGAGIYRRYFYLIAFRSYLISRVSLQGSSSAGDSAFSAWMQARPELGHLCDNLKLKWNFFPGVYILLTTGRRDHSCTVFKVCLLDFVKDSALFAAEEDWKPCSIWCFCTSYNTRDAMLSPSKMSWMQREQMSFFGVGG